MFFVEAVPFIVAPWEGVRAFKRYHGRINFPDLLMAIIRKSWRRNDVLRPRVSILRMQWLFNGWDGRREEQ
jgi:hypothetical protein